MIRYLILSSLFLAFGLICYHIFLKQEKAFVANRFFLIGALIISLIIPFITIPVEFLSIENEQSHGSLEIFETATSIVPRFEETEVDVNDSAWIFSWTLFLVMIYLVGVGLMLVRFINGLLKIRQIRLQSNATDQQNIFINERLSQPFSFWNMVFLCSKEQQQDEHLLAHELVHVHQFHSVDILLAELLMIAYWFNPLVYLYRKSISLNHEFEADQKAIRYHSDIKDYLYKVVGVSQNHRPQLALASNFSFVSLKSRLHMITKKESTRMVKALKWSFILIVSMTLLSAFVVKPVSGLANPDNEFVVVIDAGHGGKDPGTNNKKGHQEKDVVLSVAKLLQEEFAGTNIKVVMSRSDDTYLTLEERIKLTEQADLNVSLHVETMDSDRELQLFIYDEGMPYAEQSERIARVMALQFDDEDCGSVGHSNYRVLREAKCPSVMAILGVFSNPEMEKRMLSKSGQKDIADRLSKAIRIASL